MRRKMSATLLEAPERVIALKATVMEEIRERIMDGRYALGQRLSENQLAQEMNTSRAPVHDALLTLRNEGLVQIFPQRGSFVFNPGPEEIFSLYEVSGVYEMGALCLAMERDLDTLVQMLEDAMLHGHEALRKQDRRAWAKADRLFHESIVHVAGNLFLTQAYQSIVARTAALVFQIPLDIERMKNSLRQHEQISSFVKKGDFEKASRMLRANNQTMGRTGTADKMDDV